MKNFLEPDKTWKEFGILSQEDFVEKFVVYGKFHKNVPSAIVKDYEIVERLQFYSYYKFEFVDEAFARATKIFEASVDLRIQELGLEITEKFENLNAKIKKLGKFSTPELLVEWNQVRQIRNVFAHHKTGRLFGVTLLNTFASIINVINSVFLNVDDILLRQTKLKTLQAKASEYADGLFLIRIEGQFSVISSCVPLAISENSGKEQSLWGFELVYNKSEIKELDDFGHPVFFTFECVEIGPSSIKAKIAEVNEEVEIFTTDEPEAKTRLDMFKNAVLNVDPELKKVYEELTQQRILIMISKFIHSSWSTSANTR